MSQNAGSRKLVAALMLSLVLGAGAATSMMGPPIACHPISIGDAKSLPMESGAPKQGYSSAKLVTEVAEILKSEPNLLVHMETLRRAASYVRAEGSEAAQRGVAWEILGRILAQAMEHEAAGKDSSASWLDAGFLVAAYEQSGAPLGIRVGVRDNITGYAYVSNALELARKSDSPSIGDMEYAAALLTIPVMRSSGRTAEQVKHDKDAYETHIRQAAIAAKPGSLLETNLAAHLSNWGGSLEKARAEAKTQETRDATARR